MANPLVSRPVNTSKGFSSVTANSLVVQDDFPINKAIHTQEIVANNIKLEASNTTSVDGASIRLDYDGTVANNNSVRLMYINMANHTATTGGIATLYGIRIDTDTDATDSGAGIAIRNAGQSDCIYLNVAGKSSGTTGPTGIGMDVNNTDNTGHIGFGMQIWDHTSTDLGTGGPTGIYLKKHVNLDTQHKLLKLRANKNAVCFEMSGATATNALMFSQDINTFSVPFRVNADGSIDCTAYKVAGVAGASGTFTTADAKTVTVTNGMITSIV